MMVSTGRALSLPDVALVLGALLGAAATTAAQNPPLPPPGQSQEALQQAVLQNPSLADSIRRRLEASGLTPEQVRARLAASGYPAGLLDAYLGPPQAGQAGPQPGPLELTVIQSLGLGPVPTLRSDSIRVDISVANVRVNQVYVVGEVKQPGAYQISALGTALTALYAAGGITTRANMRGIEVLRLNQVAATLDLYDYLLRGDKRGDLRLETGDVVYVPLRGKRTQITGAVPRPAIYELKEGEALAELIRAAGGFRQDAALERVTIHRILPAAVRGTGPFPRAVMNVPLPVAPPAGEDPPGTANGAHGDESIGGVSVPALSLENGDSVVVDSIAPLDSSYFVVISGAVNKAGRFPWREGMTLRE